jgi:hypothetical protein
MCELFEAEEFLKMYDYDLDTAIADGAGREFIEAEAVLYGDHIARYNEGMEARFQQGLSE